MIQMSSFPRPHDAPSTERINAFLRATYNAAAEHFDDPPLSFWDHFGSRTVEVAGVRPGDKVLDVCCGIGASALPAAERALPAGRVLAVDLADRLLDLGRARARQRGLSNLEFAPGDLNRLDVAEASFDVVLCVFGLFFAPDLPPAAAGLWRAVRPGGSLVVTTWGRRLLEPANTMYWEAVEAERPDLRPGRPPQERIAEPADLASLLVEIGAEEPQMLTETWRQRVSPEDFWVIVLGSGHRMAVDSMGPDAAARVRDAVLNRLVAEGVAEVVGDVTYGRAAKPMPEEAGRG